MHLINFYLNQVNCKWLHLEITCNLQNASFLHVAVGIKGSRTWLWDSLFKLFFARENSQKELFKKSRIVPGLERRERDKEEIKRYLFRKCTDNNAWCILSDDYLEFLWQERKESHAEKIRRTQITCVERVPCI